MKKLGIWLFIVFLFLAGLYAVVQGEIGRNITRKLLLSTLEQSGLEVTIGQIEGTLPHQIDLKQVSITGKGTHVTIEELRLRPILWRLLKKELAFTDVHAKGISWEGQKGVDFDGTFRVNAKRAAIKGQLAGWEVAGKFDRRSAKFTAERGSINVQGTASWGPDIQFHVAVNGIGVEGMITDAKNLVWQVPQWHLKGKGEAVWNDPALKGEITAEGLAKLTFDLEIGTLLSGKAALQIDNLQSFHIPNAFGKLEAKTEWGISDGIQTVQLDAAATDIYYGAWFARKLSVYSDLQNPFGHVAGLIDVAMEQGNWRDLHIENGSFETVIGETNAPFTLFTEGNWSHPLEIRMNGTWRDSLIADIQGFTGTFYDHPFALARAVHMEVGNEKLILPDVEIEIAGGSVFVNIEENNAQLHLRQMPLDILSLNPLDVPVSGTLNCDADIWEKNHQLQGKLTASIDDMKVADTIDASGKLEGKLDRDHLHLKGDLFVGDQSLFDMDVAIPIHVAVWPFKMVVLNHKDAKGEIRLHGPVEEVLDFFDLGPHRLEGTCNGVLRFSNTLYRPLVEGTILFENGVYQNYYTGTVLHGIRADFLAEKNTLYLRSLTAENGTVTGDGEIHLLQSEHYPFRFDAAFQNFAFAEIDLVHATAAGKIHIEGNAISALAKGDVQILNAELTIPDHIPRPPPHLQVVYRNQIHPVAPQQSAYRPYPLFLDLNVTAPETVSIQGRGLQSEWTGNFHLGGTLTDLAAKGKLELISGEFNFSSRSFHLTDGSLSLSGREHEMPYLNLAGATETKGILITARLKGPLNNPQVTLQSNPPLPLGSIMSYLLFGQDLSEISGFQALQIATSIASLAGTGPDVLESTRKSLGIDRLRVITDPTEEGGETVSLQVGKYVAEGVLVSFTQGTEESSTNISVEVELKHNFVFQIESDQHQEQGKFTLKWNLNY